MIRQPTDKRRRRKRRIQSKIKGVRTRPRLSVFRSNRFIYAQLIDDVSGKTLLAKSDRKLTLGTTNSPKSKSKVERAKVVGALLGKEAVKKGYKTVVFDRNVYRYAGRVKALAEGAREGGLKF